MRSSRETRVVAERSKLSDRRRDRSAGRILPPVRCSAFVKGPSGLDAASHERLTPQNTDLADLAFPRSTLDRSCASAERHACSAYPLIALLLVFFIGRTTVVGSLNLLLYDWPDQASRIAGRRKTGRRFCWRRVGRWRPLAFQSNIGKVCLCRDGFPGWRWNGCVCSRTVGWTGWIA